MKDRNWLKKNMRISAVQCNLDENSDDIFKNFTLDFGFNVEQLNHLFKEDYQGDFVEEKHGKRLDEYLKKAHASGIKEIIYYNVHALDWKDQFAHPEWVQRYRDGKVIPVYGSQVLGCLNSVWREDCLRRLTDLARHDIDGIFLDGPLFYINGCYCDDCRKKFFGKYNKDYEQATFKEYLDFRMDSLAEFVGDIHEAVNQVNPGIILYLNNSALRADITGSNTRKLWKYVDIIGAEGGFFVVNKVESLYLPSAMAKDIECKAEGKPTVIFIAGDSKPNSYYMHTAAETARVFAQSVSNGANVWYGLHGPTYLAKSEGAQRAKEFLEYLKKYAEYYENTTPYSKIALLWSTDTADYYSSNVASSDFTGDGIELGNSEKRGDHYREFIGCYEMLAQNHVQFDVVDEVSLAKGLSGYDLLVAPCCACLNEAAMKSLRSFVEAGGNVLATLEIGTYDEYGNDKPNGVMEEVFGVRKRDTQRTWEGLCYQSADTEKFADFPPLLPAPTVFSEVDLLAAQAECFRCPPLPGRYERLESPDKNMPAVTVSAYGKGKAVLFTGNVGTYYYDWKDKHHLKMFGSYVKAAADPVTETDAPKCVEMTLRKRGDGFVLHLINLSVGSNRPMDEILPVYHFTVRIKGIGKKTARKVTGEPLPVRTEGEDIVISVEELKDYVAIVVE